MPPVGIGILELRNLGFKLLDAASGSLSRSHIPFLGLWPVRLSVCHHLQSKIAILAKGQFPGIRVEDAGVCSEHLLGHWQQTARRRSKSNNSRRGGWPADSETGAPKIMVSWQEILGVLACCFACRTLDGHGV